MGKRKSEIESVGNCDVVDFSIERHPVVVTRVASANTTRHTVIPTITDGGVECVAVNSWTPWLGKAFAVKVATGHPDRDILYNFVKEVGRRLIDGALPADARRARPSLEGSDDSQASKGRAALGLSEKSDSTSDSDEDEPARNGSNTRFMKLEEEARKTCLKEYRTVTIDGLEISAKLRARGKGIVVPNDGHLANLMKVLRGRLTQGWNSEVETRASKRQKLTEEREAAKIIPNCMRYFSLAHAGRYTIFYTGPGGKASQKSFQVPRRDLAGNVLDPKVFAHNREVVRQKAAAEWNERDTSNLPRLSLTSAGA